MVLGMGIPFSYFLMALEEAAEAQLQPEGIGADEARMGCGQLISHIRALAIAKRLKPVALNLDRMDDRACAKLVAASPILSEWIHIQDDKLIFSNNISAQEAGQMFELVKLHHKVVLVVDPPRPPKVEQP